METPSSAFDGDVETGKNRRDRHCAAFLAKSDTRGKEARYSRSVAEDRGQVTNYALGRLRACLDFSGRAFCLR